jgi:hypothetical protein
MHVGGLRRDSAELGLLPGLLLHFRNLLSLLFRLSRDWRGKLEGLGEEEVLNVIL